MSDLTWAWMTGPTEIAQFGVYESKNVYSQSARPGARNSMTGWFEPVNSTLWLIGGYGIGSSGASGSLNDLWHLRSRVQWPAPAAAPELPPQSPPQAAPQAAPQAPPHGPPELPPQSPPQSPPHGPPELPPQSDWACFGPTPEGNVTCIDGRWFITTNASELFTITSAASSPTVSFPSNYTFIVFDTVTVSNLTIVLPLSGNVSQGGRLEMNNCVNMSGSVEITMSNSAILKPGDKIKLISSTRPECFNVSLSATITATPQSETGLPTECSSRLVASPSTESRYESVSLYLIVSIVDPPASCLSQVQPTVSAGLVAGVVIGIFVFASIVGVIIWYVRYREAKMEEKRVQDQVIHTKLAHHQELQEWNANN